MKTEEEYHIYDTIIAKAYSKIGGLISNGVVDFIYTDDVYSKLFLRVALMYLNTCGEDIKITLRRPTLISTLKMKWEYRKNKRINIRKKSILKDYPNCTYEFVDICHESGNGMSICKDIWEEYYA